MEMQSHEVSGGNAESPDASNTRPLMQSTPVHGISSRYFVKYISAGMWQQSLSRKHWGPWYGWGRHNPVLGRHFDLKKKAPSVVAAAEIREGERERLREREGEGGREAERERERERGRKRGRERESKRKSERVRGSE